MGDLAILEYKGVASMKKLSVIFCGACGRMGKVITKAIEESDEFNLIAKVDIVYKSNSLTEFKNLKSCLEKFFSTADVIIDFTTPDAVYDNIITACHYQIPIIVGTTGLTEEQLLQIEKIANEKNIPVLIVPNFALGAVLMMEFSKLAARFMKAAEIIELHHPGKLDSPSGTSKLTASKMKFNNKINDCGRENVKGVRGGIVNGIRIHSIRLPGLLAHQQVIFGGVHETLEIRHDSFSRECFIPGIFMALRKIKNLTGLTIGLDKLIDFNT